MTWPAVAAMGDYAVYVWSSFMLLLTAIAGELLLLRRRRHAQRDSRHSQARSHRQVNP
jgi:heme exporter protein CcmD